MGEAIGSPRIIALFKKFPHTYTYILARKIHSFNNVDVSITLFPMSPLIIYHLTGITHRAVIARERERREGKFRVGFRGEKTREDFSRGVRWREEVRDNSQRYSVARKYKLNPAATAIEIWNHIVSIYHSERILLRRVLEPLTLPARCVRDLVEDI